MSQPGYPKPSAFVVGPAELREQHEWFTITIEARTVEREHVSVTAGTRHVFVVFAKGEARVVRNVPLPANISLAPDSAEVTLRNGVLDIVVRKETPGGGPAGWTLPAPEASGEFWNGHKVSP